MTKVYIFTDETIEKLSNDWYSLFSQKYVEWIELIKERTEKINKAHKSGVPLSDINDAFISSDFFREAKKELRLYSHRFRDTIDLKMEDETFSPMKEENFDRMKQINASATKLYKQFSDAHNSYKNAEQIYKMKFLSTFQEIDFMEIAKRIK